MRRERDVKLGERKRCRNMEKILTAGGFGFLFDEKLIIFFKEDQGILYRVSRNSFRGVILVRTKVPMNTGWQIFVLKRSMPPRTIGFYFIFPKPF